jgi:hypothetical protein
LHLLEPVCNLLAPRGACFLMHMVENLRVLFAVSHATLGVFHSFAPHRTLFTATALLLLLQLSVPWRP